MTQKKKSPFFLASVVFLTGLLFCAQASNVFAANILKSVEGTQLNIYTTGERFVFDIVLQAAAAAATPVSWSVKNYFGVDVSSGNTSVAAGLSAVQVDLGFMDTGHYVVTASVPGENVSGDFAVVIPYEKRKPLADSPFATDTAMSVHRPASIANNFARAVQLSGVTWVRERMSWARIEISKESYSYISYDNSFIKAFSDRGIKVLECFEGGTPDWAITNQEKAAANQEAKNAGLPLPYKLPDDLIQFYKFIQNAASHYSGSGAAGKISMWEILNETSGEVYLGKGDGADRYAVYLKVASIGVRDSTVPNPLVTVGGIDTISGHSRPYYDTVFENGIVDYIDVFNFHNHQTNVNVNGDYDTFSTDRNVRFAEYKNRQTGAASMPTWITEAGGAIAVPAYEDFEGDYAKQQAQARYLVTSAAMSLASGTDKHFWFIGRALHERSGAIYWGSFSLKDTPYAAYAAQAAMTEALGEAKYRGELTNLPAGAKGYVFKDGTDTVLVLWDARSATSSSTATLSLIQSSGTLTDIMGGKRSVTSAGGTFNLTLSPDPVYLRVSGDIATYASGVNRVITPKTLTSAQRIVLDQVYPLTSCIADDTNNVFTQRAYLKNIYSDLTVKVIVYNFNDIAITGVVTGSFDAAGYTVSAPQSVTVPARSSETLVFTVKSAVTYPVLGAQKLTFTGNFDGIGKTSPSVSYVKDKPDANDLGQLVVNDPCNDLGSWIIRAGGSNWQIVDGKLTMSASGGFTNYKGMADKGMAVGDGVISVKMNLKGHYQTPGDNNYWAGLCFRQSENGNNVFNTDGYFINIFPNGQLGANKGSAGGNSTTLLYGVQTSVDMTGKEVELMVVMRGSRFDIYLDGRFIAFFIDDSYESGCVGTVSLYSEVAFDDFKIWTAAQAAVTVGAQSGSLSAGIAGSVTFPVTTAHVADGTYQAVLNGAPAGVTGSVTIAGSSGTLTVNTAAATPQGAHPLTFTIGGLTSNNFNLTVANKVSLDDVKYYPNPIRPSKGQNYAKMNFSNIPAGTRIKIYTMLGQLVRDLKADAIGTTVWDGKNNTGAKAASGVYIVYMEDGDGNKKRIKVAVER